MAREPQPGRDVLARRLRPRRRTVGRRDAVEVPRRRLGRALGRAARRAQSRRSRTPTRATGRTDWHCCERGCRPLRWSSRLTSADDGRDQRQLGIVDARRPRAATFTGADCHEWAGGRTGAGYAAQGNILVSAATVDALAETFEATAGTLAERLLELARGRQAAGGDRRGQQSAALLVVERDGGYAGLSDVLVDLRVDDHEQPVEELRRLYGLHEALFGTTPRAELDRGRRRAARRDRRAPRAARVRAARGLGGRREPRGARRRRGRGRSGRPGGAEEERVSGYQVAQPDRARVGPGARDAALDAAAHAFGIGAFGINAYTARRGRAGRHRGAHREADRPRGALPRPRRPGDIRARRRRDRRARRDDRLPPRSEGPALRGAEEPGTTVLAVGAKRGAHEVSAWEDIFAAYGAADEDPEASERRSRPR